MITDILIKYEIPADLTDESETVKKLTPIIHTIINNEHFTTLEHLFQYFSAQLISVILNTCGELGISCQKALLNKNRLCRIKRDLIDAYANEYQPQGIFSIQDESQIRKYTYAMIKSKQNYEHFIQFVSQSRLEDIQLLIHILKRFDCGKTLYCILLYRLSAEIVFRCFSSSHPKDDHDHFKIRKYIHSLNFFSPIKLTMQRKHRYIELNPCGDIVAQYLAPKGLY